MAEQPRLTLAWLERVPHLACMGAREAFARRWPGGVAPISEVLRALADHPLGLGWWTWLASRQHPDLKLIAEQYVAAIKPIKERHATALKLIDERYKAAFKPIGDQYDAAVSLVVMQDWAVFKSIDERYKAACKFIDEQYAAAFEPIEEQYDADCRDILRQLARQLEEGVA